MVQIARLIQYPLKSAMGQSVNRLTIDAYGPVDDRQWVLVDHTNHFLTAREHPQLLKISVESVGADWQFQHPNHDQLLVSLDPAAQQVEGMIWKDAFTGYQASETANSWFSNILGLPVRLLHWRSGSRIAGKYQLPTRFADAAPILLASEASLACVNDWAGEIFEMARFRPNIVLSGCDGFAEERASAFLVAGQTLKVMDRCERCVLITRDPQTTEKHSQYQPFKALKEKHTAANGKPVFGVNATIEGADSITLNVGDDVEIVAQ